MSTPTLGTRDAGGPMRIDVDRLIRERLLVASMSGFGKSYAVRRILEQTHGHVQHLVLDPEGEFFTLRERFDYLYAAADREGADCPADPRSAKLLARKLLELQVSAVIDVYELDPERRRAFVREFLGALVNAPRRLWHPALVVIDEAHDYAPEGKASETRQAVVDLCARGRKRGFAAVLATQRLAKLAKDAAAECGNVLVGRATLDVDVKRSAELLGLATKQDAQALRTLRPGEFYALGSALAPEGMEGVTVGRVQTTHPSEGGAAPAPPPPRDAIEKVLGELRDLPAQAEEEARTLEAAQRRVRELERELREARKGAPAPDPEALARAREEGFQRAARTLDEERARMVAQVNSWARRVARAVDAALPAVSKAAEALGDAERAVREPLDVDLEPVRGAPRGAPRARAAGRPGASPGVGGESATPRRAAPSGARRGGLSQRLLDALAWLEGAGVPAPRRRLLGFLAGGNLTGGHGANVVSALRTEGLLDYPEEGLVALTEAGRAAARPPAEALTAERVQARVKDQVSGLGARIVEALVEVYPEDLSREEVGARVGATLSGGHGANVVSRLHNSAEAITYPAKGRLRAAPWLFLEGA